MGLVEEIEVQLMSGFEWRYTHNPMTAGHYTYDDVLRRINTQLALYKSAEKESVVKNQLKIEKRTNTQLPCSFIAEGQYTTEMFYFSDYRTDESIDELPAAAHAAAHSVEINTLKCDEPILVKCSSTRPIIHYRFWRFGKTTECETVWDKNFKLCLDTRLQEKAGHKANEYNITPNGIVMLTAYAVALHAVGKKFEENGRIEIKL